MAAGSENEGSVVKYGLKARVGFDLGDRLGLGFGNPWFFGATWKRAEIQSDIASLNASCFSGARKGRSVPYVPAVNAVQLVAGTGLETLRWGLAWR